MASTPDPNIPPLNVANVLREMRHMPQRVVGISAIHREGSRIWLDAPNTAINSILPTMIAGAVATRNRRDRLEPYIPQELRDNSGRRPRTAAEFTTLAQAITMAADQARYRSRR